MPPPTPLLLVLVLATACLQDPTPVELTIPEGAGDPTTAADAPAGGGGGACTVVVDGKFTGWTPPVDGQAPVADAVEWGCGYRLEGVYGVMHALHQGDRLYFLNDWKLNTEGPIDPECYNLFFFNLNGLLYEIRLFGDQHIEVLAGGLPYDEAAEGRTTFGLSPDLPDTPHSIFEFSLRLPIPELTEVTLFELDPGSSSNCDADDKLVPEPTILKGTISSDGTITAEGRVDAPVVTSISATEVFPGDAVTLTGVNFGPEIGRAFVAGQPCAIAAWQDDAVVVTIPAVAAGLRPVVLTTGSATTSPVSILVACTPLCDGKQCGDDGCGGSCGACPEGQECAKNDRCLTP